MSTTRTGFPRRIKHSVSGELTPFRVVLVCLCAITCLAHAGTGMGLSAPFQLNTSNGVQNRAYADSDPAFSLNTRFPGGPLTTKVSGFFILDTRQLTLSSIEVAGPPTVQGGKSAFYTATAVYTNGVREDVTEQAEWYVLGGPPSSDMVGSSFYPTATSEPVNAAVSARFTRWESTRAGRLIVTVTPGMTVRLGEVQVSAGVGNRSSGSWTLAATAQTVGGTPPYHHTWSLLPTALGTSGASPSLSTTVTNTPGRKVLQVTVQDSGGLTLQRHIGITLPVPAVGNEPTNLRTANSLATWSLRNATDTGPLVLNPSLGLIIICHGLKDGPGLVDTEGVVSDWQKTMAANITARLVQEGKPVPNIGLLDWREGAEPSVSCAFGCTAYSGAELAWWQEQTNIFTNVLDAILGEKSAGGIGQIRDFIYIKPNGLQQGQALADWIKTETEANHLSPAAKVQIIGHSAGGFVAGECALMLKNTGLPMVDQVTMLDTPFPVRNHYTTYTEGPDGGKVDRYISSVAGQCAPTLEMRRVEKKLLFASLTGNSAATIGFLALKYLTVEPGTHYYKQDVPDGPLNPLNIVARHSWAWKWYIRTAAVTSTEEDGFYFSPFMEHTWQTNLLGGQGAGAPFAASSPPPPPLESPLMTGWETFGSVGTDAAGFTLTEGTGNAGVFREITFPAGAESLRFEAQFTQAGDGDFLAVYFGDQPALYAISDLAIFRSGLMSFEVPLGAYSETSGRLTIKLETTGATQSQARLENLRLQINDDLDHDGLPNDQELAVGTLSSLWDSDGDNLGDGEEVHTHLTNPSAPDSDGDGQDDDRELMAATDPLSANSVFRVSNTRSSPFGGILLEWPSVVGKKYRVLRSPDLARDEVDVIAQPYQAMTNFTQFTDPAPPLAGAAFYWVEVVE